VKPRVKTAGSPAEYAGEVRPDGMQRLLSSAVWDTDGVRDDLCRYVVEQLGHQGAVIALDETSFKKRGKKSAGVGLQYCGTTGQVENWKAGCFPLLHHSAWSQPH
jgi:SRSO17 transposase